MRKVIYEIYLHANAVDKARWSDPQSGYFHCWGTDVIESADSSVQYTVAIIEDVTTGNTHKVDPSKMRFVQPPETRQHSSDINPQSAIVLPLNAEVGINVAGLLVKILTALEEINNKMDTL